MARTKKGTTKQRTPKQATPKQSAPKQAVPKQAVPKQPAPKQPVPKQPVPKQAVPKQAVPKQAVPKQPAPKQPAPKQPAPKQPAPKQPAPKQPAPKQPAPKQPAPKQPAPKQAKPPQPSPPVSHADTCPTGTFNPLGYMTEEELNDIDNQFASSLAEVDVVLFWTGVEWAHVQKWATLWNMKTLTIAMGPLMDPNNPSSPKVQKRRLPYSRYVKGASGRFAQYAREHCRVIVLTNPPPCIYSERENNTYQSLEEPILKGRFGGSPVRRIDYLHPTVDGAAHVTYQVWPCDRTEDYTASFGSMPVSSWKTLNWSYQTLVTTSQLNLELQRTQYRSSRVPIMPSQPRDQRACAPSDVLSFSKTLPETSVDVTNVALDTANGEDGERLLQSVDTVGGHISASSFDIKGHDSRDLNAQSRRGVSIGSTTGLTKRQSHYQVERGTNLHESGLLHESNCLQTPVYVIERCQPPASPVAVPVVNIDDLTVGVDVNIDINEHGLNKDFLYLTMKVGPELKCWKLRWAQTEKTEAAQVKVGR